MNKAYLVVFALALGACINQGSSTTTGVALGEFFVTPDNRILEAGSIEISLENHGRFSHTFLITDDSGTVVVATDLIAPETTTALTVSLEPGSYMFTCRIVKGLDDGTVVDHYQEGMAAAVEVVA